MSVRHIIETIEDEIMQIKVVTLEIRVSPQPFKHTLQPMKMFLV